MPQSKQQIPFRGFCEIALNEDDFSNLDKSVLSPEEIILHMAKMCSLGYSITIKTDTTLRRTKISSMDNEPTRASAGWCLTAESDNLTNALIVLLYKHEAKMGGDWVPFCNSTREMAKYR